MKVQEKREEKLGNTLFDGIKQLQDKALDLLGKMEEQGDYRGAVLAAREARECLLSANELLARAGSGPNGAQIDVRVTFIGAQR
ncbi:MAG TPA: hypothetical protein VJN92_22845 [Candidatus Acidoferrum sp.]|nr:hypothetical protein [Candidatus Acidoferrum sp.]